MEGNMDGELQGKIYKSPIRKLAGFFEQSRNQWKVKCLESKMAIKLLRNKIRYSEQSKTKLREKVAKLEKEIAQFKEPYGKEDELEQKKLQKKRRI